MTDFIRKLVALVLLTLFAGAFFSIGLLMVVLVLVSKTLSVITNGFVSVSNRCVIVLGKLGGWQTPTL
jgi:hypothetical protein